jgi:hypothetical protein
MSNFRKTFIDGQRGLNIGLTTGIKALDKAIHKIQKKTSIGIAAQPKVGKTTLVDFAFLVSPYLQMLEEGRLNDIEWIYFSYEIDRVSKEFKIAALFMFIDYNIHSFEYKDSRYLMSQDYLMGKLEHENPDGTTELIPLSAEHSEMLKTIYLNRIIPLFGEYDENNKKIKHGKIFFIEDPDNPTGMDKYLKAYAEKHGTFHYEEYTITDDKGVKVKKKRVVSYTENNPKKFTIVITDHLRKLRKERGFTMKENMDKWLEYNTWIRNMCYFTPINVCHSNRNLANMERLKYAGEFIFPTADDVKDTGNLAEESTILMTLFNPNDEKYNLAKHFGVELKDHPLYRSLHITESRYTECPVHIQLNMFGNVNYFSPLTQTYGT